MTASTTRQTTTVQMAALRARKDLIGSVAVTFAPIGGAENGSRSFKPAADSTGFAFAGGLAKPSAGSSFFGSTAHGAVVSFTRRSLDFTPGVGAGLARRTQSAAIATSPDAIPSFHAAPLPLPAKIRTS